MTMTIIYFKTTTHTFDIPEHVFEYPANTALQCGQDKAGNNDKTEFAAATKEIM